MIAKFTYNNIKNANTGYTSFKLNCIYHFHISLIKSVNSYSQSKSITKLVTKIIKLLTAYWKNPYHAQKLQKYHYDKNIKPRNYIPNNKVWLNSIYIKSK